MLDQIKEKLKYQQSENDKKLTKYIFFALFVTFLAYSWNDTIYFY